jgi:hypothetical protein
VTSQHTDTLYAIRGTTGDRELLLMKLFASRPEAEKVVAGRMMPACAGHGFYEVVPVRVYVLPADPPAGGMPASHFVQAVV